MKTSNLLGILAVGGIGYYLLKKQKNKVETPLVSATPPSTTYIPETNVQSKLVENPYATAPTSTIKPSTNTYSTTTPTVQVNPIDLTLGLLPTKSNTIPTITSTPITPSKPITPSIAITPSTPIVPITTPSIPSVKIENALSTLGLQTNCEIPSEGWDDNIVGNYMKSFNSTSTKAILNPQYKSTFYSDECGNILFKPSVITASYTQFTQKPDGFYTKTGFGFPSPPVKYYIKDNKAYFMPAKLVFEYKNKYLLPYISYLKNLPKIDRNLATEAQFNSYPKDGVWVIKPENLEVFDLGLAWGGLPSQPTTVSPTNVGSNCVECFDKMMTQKDNDGLAEDGVTILFENIFNGFHPNIKFLILNPRVRNKNQFYVDQYGNINIIPEVGDAKYKSFPNGYTVIPWYEIAEYRVKNNIPF